MELKPPKARKKNSKTWSKMLRTPVLVLFLMTAINCEDRTSDNIDSSDASVAPIRWRHRAHRHFKINASDSDAVILSDIKYLKKHMNREIVNFVMKDTLFDGEVETRVHYGGVTAKETSVGSDGSGLKLRQLTDGRHLVQLIYGADGVLQDCEFLTQGKAVRNFLKTIRGDLKQALDEESFRIYEERNHNRIPTESQDKFQRHFANVTFEVIQDGDGPPQSVASWLNYENLKAECLKTHEQIKYMIDNRKEIADQTVSRSRRSFRELVIIPETKWCGVGQLAGKYNELGPARRADRCCRRHDLCRTNVGAFKRKYGLFNFRPYTVSHCKCDRRRKRDAMEILRVPGTKWCGKGYSATRYSQLGGHTSTDRCCRVHDLRCPHWIAGMSTKYGLFNWRVNTLMHCRCDERFRACLKLADTSVSNMVGNLFFNVVQTKCFVLKPVKVCMQRSWWGKCLKKGYTKQAFLRDNLPY